MNITAAWIGIVLSFCNILAMQQEINLENELLNSLSKVHAAASRNHVGAMRNAGQFHEELKNGERLMHHNPGLIRTIEVPLVLRYCGQPDIVALLLKYGAPLAGYENDKNTALHRIFQGFCYSDPASHYKLNDYKRSLTLLMNAGASMMNDQNSEGNTPLMLMVHCIDDQTHINHALEFVKIVTQKFDYAMDTLAKTPHSYVKLLEPNLRNLFKNRIRSSSINPDLKNKDGKTLTDLVKSRIEQFERRRIFGSNRSSQAEKMINFYQEFLKSITID